MGDSKSGMLCMRSMCGLSGRAECCTLRSPATGDWADRRDPNYPPEAARARPRLRERGDSSRLDFTFLASNKIIKRLPMGILVRI